MTDSRELRRRIEQSGYKYKFLAQKIGVCPSSLQFKIDNKREFRVSELDGLAGILGLTPREKDAIFFCESGVI